MQHTIKNQISMEGIALHSGLNVSMFILPAATDTGIIFKRSDILDENKQAIAAHFANVVDSSMCTKIANKHGVSVATIEHLMSALWASNVDNAIIMLDGPEVPIMDGSADYFVEAIRKTGTIQQNKPRQIIKVLKPIMVEAGDNQITLMPTEDGDFSIEFSIEFNHPAIGNQALAANSILIQDYSKEIGKARTFGFIQDVEKLQQLGLAKGASLNNAIGLDNEKVVNTEGLRYPDEFVRHKILDCIGDLYLAGKRLVCKVKAHKSSHALNNDALHKLFADNSAYLYSNLG